MDRIQWIFLADDNDKEVDVASPADGGKHLVYDRVNNILQVSAEAFPWTVSQASPGSDLLL